MSLIAITAVLGVSFLAIGSWPAPRNHRVSEWRRNYVVYRLFGHGVLGSAYRAARLTLVLRGVQFARERL